MFQPLWMPHADHDLEQELTVFVNFLRNKELNTVHIFETDTVPGDQLPIGRLHQHPWMGIEVLIHRQGHPRKGETGLITAVLPPVMGSEIKRIEIQSTRYNPAVSFPRMITECTDVVECR